MSIESAEDFEALKRAGVVVARALAAMRAAVAPGVRTVDLDAVAADVMAEHGARSAPRLVYRFPGTTCISVNEEAVHGIPGARALRDGDVVSLDVTVELDGYFADAAVTVAVPPASPVASRLIAAAEAAFWKGAAAARPGARVCDVGGAIEAEVQRWGFRTLRQLCGHGIGRTIHEPPSVVNYYEPRLHDRLAEGQVIAMEPIVSTRTRRSRTLPDGWTVVSADGGLAAHYEHTIVITAGEPVLLTAA